MAIETVYKLVSRGDCELESWRTGPTQWRVEYPIGVAVRPKMVETLLFAFKELGAAAFWHRREKNTEIWEAEAEDPIPVCEVSDSFSPSRMSSFWINYKWGVVEFCLGGTIKAPITTVACKSIRLIRQIEREELERTV